MMNIIATMVFAGLTMLAFYTVRRRRARTPSTSLQASCGKASTFWSKDPLFHLDFTVISHTDAIATTRYHQRYGKTYAVDSLLGIPYFLTIAPENLQALFSQAKDFGVEGIRLAGMDHLCGHGFLTSDGPVWKTSRKMLKPSFARSNITDLDFLDRETDSLIAKIRSGSTIDLQELLFLTVRPTVLNGMYAAKKNSS
jgi:cytochrome P450